MLFISFSPAVSDKAGMTMRSEVRRWRLHHHNDLELDEVARWARPKISGWVQYYGRFRLSALRVALRTIDQFLVRWAQRKYKKLRGRVKKSWDWLRRIKAQQPDLFPHWRLAETVGR